MCVCVCIVWLTCSHFRPAKKLSSEQFLSKKSAVNTQLKTELPLDRNTNQKLKTTTTTREEVFTHPVHPVLVLGIPYTPVQRAGRQDQNKVPCIPDTGQQVVVELARPQLLNIQEDCETSQLQVHLQQTAMSKYINEQAHRWACTLMGKYQATDLIGLFRSNVCPFQPSLQDPSLQAGDEKFLSTFTFGLHVEDCR